MKPIYNSNSKRITFNKYQHIYERLFWSGGIEGDHEPVFSLVWSTWNFYKTENWERYAFFCKAVYLHISLSKKEIFILFNRFFSFLIKVFYLICRFYYVVYKIHVFFVSFSQYIYPFFVIQFIFVEKLLREDIVNY